MLSYHFWLSETWITQRRPPLPSNPRLAPRVDGRQMIPADDQRHHPCAAARPEMA